MDPYHRIFFYNICFIQISAYFKNNAPESLIPDKQIASVSDNINRDFLTPAPAQSPDKAILCFRAYKHISRATNPESGVIFHRLIFQNLSPANNFA